MPTDTSANHSSARAARDPALDLLRTVALGRVVVWHVVGAAWLTAFAAIPLMFFVAGTLLAGSLEARRPVELLVRRAKRLLLPLWLYGAAVASVGVVQARPTASTSARKGWACCAP